MRKTEEGSPDETNSKRDVLLIILTPGVRLNERRSQTREARCKFNYREEESVGRRARRERGGERVRGRKERQRGPTVAADCVCAREKERERVSGRGREIFKYLYDGSLFRPLINGTEEGRCN